MSMRIWFALLVAPILALTDQSVAYAMTGWACAHQQAFAMHGIHVIFLAATLAGTIAAGGLWRTTSASKTRNETLARRHFLAGLATASGTLSALVIAAMWIPNWLLSPCFA
jgi:hypothetical protein